MTILSGTMFQQMLHKNRSLVLACRHAFQPSYTSMRFRFFMSKNNSLKLKAPQENSCREK